MMPGAFSARRPIGLPQWCPVITVAVSQLVNTRAPPVDMIFTRLCGLVPLYVLGLAAPLGGSVSVIPMIVQLLGTIWGFFLHANVRWRFGRLEWLLATPAFDH
jgi:sterol desaturase/sphingolipid hydroxylase (fatty acid hydroxylase superfamily)